MAFLGEALTAPPGPRVLAPPRCTKDWIAEELFAPRRDLFRAIDLVFFDPSSRCCEGAGGQELGQHGQRKDPRPDLKPRVVGWARDAQGWPLCCDLGPGNTAEVTPLLPVGNRVRQRFGVRRVSIVANRGRIRARTIAAWASKEMACDAI